MSDSPDKDYQPAPAQRATMGGLRLGEGSFLGGLIGAAVGTVIAWYLFLYLITNFGWVAVAMPGAVVGLGRAVMMRGKSWILAGICAAIGLAMPLYIIFTRTQHTMESLSDFNKLGIFIGGAIGFYLGLGKLRS